VTDTIEIVDNPKANRYEARIGETLAGYAEYKLTPDLIVFTHTEVLREYEGRGVGSALAKVALDDIKAAGVRKVLPLCPFIKAWIGRHAAYIPLVYGVAGPIPEERS
jgi:predicted GNAT family acetyltransferase